MSLIKLGSHLQILKTAAMVEDLLVEKPVVEAAKPVISKVLEPKNSDFLYYRARAISAGDQGPMTKEGTRGWNFNGNKDYFPRKELEASYQTFVGRNIFLDHNSESSLYSIGKIVDALPIDDPETGEFYIELVGKIDRKLHPEICRKIETGELNSTSMGCSVNESICSVCGHVLNSDADEKCEHMGMALGREFNAEVDFPEYNIKKGDLIPAFSINKGIVFNEDSIVGVPADPTAIIKNVLSNMKNHIKKNASLPKEEQLDLAAEMEKVFSKLDDASKTQLKADLTGIFPVVEKESSMADKNVTPNDETKKILNKISAYEMEQLESYVVGKTKKAEILADSASKEESFFSKIVATVKSALSTETPKVQAKFTEDKNNVLDSTWSVVDDGKTVLEASLKEIWGSDFEIMSFSDQLWATSHEYAKEIVARYTKDGVEKLATAWDVAHKLSKTAKGPELGPDGKRVKPTTGLSNKKHDYPTNPKFEKPGQEAGQKGPAAPAPAEVKDSKIEMPGQEKGQTGPAAPKAKEVKTDYSEPKPEAEGKEVKTTPKNPEEKKHEKSEKAVETSYVAKGTEAIEAEEAGEKDKKSDKKSSLLNWASLTPAAQASIKTAAKTYIAAGMNNAEAVAKAHSEFTAQEINMQKKASEGTTVPEGKVAFDAKPQESVDGSTLPEGKKEMGDKADEAVQGDTQPKGKAPSAAPETSADGDKPGKTPNMTKKPEETVEETTVPHGKKDEESVEKSTHPDGKKEMGDKPEETVKSASKTMGDKPEETVQGTTLPHDKKTMGDKSEESVDGNTQPDDKKTMGDKADASVKAAAKSESSAPVEAVQDKPALSKETTGDAPESSREGGDLKKDPKDIESVDKKAAAEIPMPEDTPAIQEDVKVEEPAVAPLDGPKVEEPKAEVSAFDASPKPVEIGEGYSAMKDKETNEVIISKDGAEIKRLPDGFGADMAAVLPLLKAVLGLPPEEAKPEMPGTVAPVEEKMEAPVEEVPAGESHEDELALKESALKAKEAALAEKEAAVNAKEAAIKEEEKVKKFASVLAARQERCKKIVAALVEKDAIQMDKEVYAYEIQTGTYLLDAQKKAFEHAIIAKEKELMAMDDSALAAAEAVTADIKAPTSGTTKKASRIYVSPSFGEELSEDAYLKKIFDTFGTKNKPQ